MRARPCLYCSTPLPRFRGASLLCEACGRINVAEDLRTYWTRAPRMVWLERALKAIVTVALIAVTGLMPMHPGSGPPAGAGYSIGVPILAAVLLWDTLGLVTRRHSVFRMEVFWPALVAAVGLGPIAVVFAITIGVGRVPSIWTGPVPSMDLVSLSLVWGSIWGAIGLVARWLVQRAMRWREGVVRRATELHAEAASSAA